MAGHIVQAIGNIAGELSGTEEYGHRHLAPKDHQGDIERHNQLGEDIRHTDAVVDKALFICLLIRGLLNLVGGAFDAPAEPEAPAEKAQDVISAQQVLQTADRRLLSPGADLAQAL